MISNVNPDPEMDHLMRTIQDNFELIDKLLAEKNAKNSDVTHLFQKSVDETTRQHEHNILTAVRKIVNDPGGIDRFLNEFVILERNWTHMKSSEATQKLGAIEATLMALRNTYQKKFIKLELEQNISERFLEMFDCIHREMKSEGESRKDEMKPHNHDISMTEESEIDQPFSDLNPALVRWKHFQGMQTEEDATTAVLAMKGVGASFLWYDKTQKALMISVKRNEGKVDHFRVDLTTMLDTASPTGLSFRFFDFLHSMGGTLSMLVEKHPTKGYDRLVRWKHYSELEKNDIMKLLAKKSDRSSIVWYDREKDGLYLLLVDNEGDENVDVQVLRLYLAPSAVLNPKSPSGMSDNFFQFLNRLNGK